MNLIDIYIYEVTKKVSEKNREDISMELRSTIEDMLPENYTETDVKNVLKKLGNPATLAKGYNDQPRYLIGPNYIDLYFTLFKMIIPIALVISFITTTTEVISVYNNIDTTLNKIIDIFVAAIGLTVELIFDFGVALTIGFVIMERFYKEPININTKEWSADDLKYIPEKKEISKTEVFFGLFWTAIWVTLFLFADRVIGIYDESQGSLAFTVPFFNQEVLLSFLPIIIILVVLEVALSIYKLIIGYWTKKLVVINAIDGLISVIATAYILLTPNIVNQDFINYDFGIPNFHSWIIIFTILMTIVAIVLEIYEGYKKARL